jgi:hypothetical protein
MTITADYLNNNAAIVDRAGIYASGAAFVKWGQRLSGAALILAAGGLWLAPGASWESDVMLIKLALTVFAAMAGIGLLLASNYERFDEIEIDCIRRELRLVRPGTRGKTVLQRCGFDAIGRAEHEGTVVRLFDPEGGIIAEAALKDRFAMASLLVGLRDVGKLG